MSYINDNAVIQVEYHEQNLTSNESKQLSKQLKQPNRLSTYLNISQVKAVNIKHSDKLIISNIDNDIVTIYGPYGRVFKLEVIGNNELTSVITLKCKYNRKLYGHSTFNIDLTTKKLYPTAITTIK